MTPAEPESDTGTNAAAPIQASLERRLFYLKTLYEFSAELSPLTDTRSLLDSFLLMAMGTLGAGQGLLVLYDRQRKAVLHALRGTPATFQWSPQTAEKRFYQGMQAASQRRLEPMSVSAVAPSQELFPEAELGFEVCTALLFRIDAALWGLMGLGPTLGAAPGEEGFELLQALTASGMIYIKNAQSFETIQALNSQLQHRNQELQQTIADLTQARHQIRGLELARGRLKQMAQRELERMGRLRWNDALLLLIIATGLALLFNFASPNGIPPWPEGLFEPPPPAIEAAAARQLLDRNEAVLVDARPPELFEQEHLPGAINVPAALFDIIYPMKLAPALQSAEKAALVYGRTFSRRYDEQVARRLLQRHDRIHVLRQPPAAWRREGQRGQL